MRYMAYVYGSVGITAVSVDLIVNLCLSVLVYFGLTGAVVSDMFFK
jgi:hypothetical protein